MLLEPRVATNLTIIAIAALHLLILSSAWRKAEAPETTDVDGNSGASDGKSPVVIKFDDNATLSKELCAFVAERAEEAIAVRGVFHLAVADGSLLDTLVGLSDHRNTVDFSKVVLSFANYLCVDHNSHKASMSKSKTKLATVAGISTFVAPSSCLTEGDDGTKEAELYAKALKDVGIPHSNGFPVLDLIILEMGSDRQIGSCHPMGPATSNSTKAVVSSAKIGGPTSITFTIETVNKARQVAVVVSSGAKEKREGIKAPL